ncbi:MAG TPA: hypothetical protein VMY40_07420 [Anaerolineae bacterium]|nr:hypothetical protein [Anaerolineae bacterium]
MTESTYPSPVSKLLTLGECREVRGWPDYLALGLRPAHVPDLIRMALDEELYRAGSDSLDVWAPVHAWRALGQLRAEAAAEPLTRLLVRIDEFDDEWVGEELPKVFGMVGPAAVPILKDYLADPSHGLWSRVAAASGLKEVGKGHPDAHAECVTVLTRQLEQFAELDPILNSFIISSLVDLEAVEATPVMERAFAADRVDISIPGDWEDVQIELGLMQGRQTPRPQYHTFWDALSPVPPSPPKKKRRRKRKRRRKSA